MDARPVRPTVAPGAPHEEAGAVHTQWPRGHFPYNEFTISRCAAGAHLACARGTMPRAPLGRTGLMDAIESDESARHTVLRRRQTLLP